MSLASECPACAVGDHGKHDADYGIVPGLIGGTYCDCAGDCGDRLQCFTVDAAARDFYFPPESVTRCTCEGRVSPSRTRGRARTYTLTARGWAVVGGRP